MMRGSIRRALGDGLGVALLVTVALGCAAQELSLIAPVPSETLQYRTDAFVVFFSPATGSAGLQGLRISLTNTTGNALSIVWKESFFVLPTGDRSDAIRDDVPASLQANPTQVSIRQTAEIVVVPLRNVSYSESGWSIRPIPADGGEFTLHLAVEIPAQETLDGYDFTFRLAEVTAGPEADPASRLPVWSVLLALGIGLLLGLLLADP